MNRIPLISVLLLVLGALSFAVGCAEESPPPASRPSGALRDPFNYKPFSSDDRIDDTKNLKKDWHDFWNP